MESSLELTDPQGRRILLAGTEMLAGRSAECSLHLADTRASRRHFILRSSPFGWQISDLGSSNGTFVNDCRLQEGDHRVLSPGDRIRAGGAVFVVQEARANAPPVRPPLPRQAEDAKAPRQVHTPGAPDLSGHVPQPMRSPRQAGLPGSAQPVWRWVALGMGAAAVVMLIASGFAPWLRLEARLKLPDLSALPGAANLPAGGAAGEAIKLLGGLAQQFFGTPAPGDTALRLPTSVNLLQHTITGLDAQGYGLMLIIAGLLAALALAADLIFISAKNTAFGVVYLLLGLTPGLVLLASYFNFDKAATRPMLWGLDLMTLLKAASPFLDLQVRPLVGIYLVGAGLTLLLVTGVLRIIAPSVRNSERI